MNTENLADANTRSDASETIDDVKDEISQVSDAGADAAKEISESRFEQGRDKATDQLDSASEAVGEVAEKLQQDDSPFASYASELSEQLSSFSNRLSTSSIDDLAGGARSLARDNPAAFMLGSMAIGLAASRFFKATGEQVSHHASDSTAHSGTHYGDSSKGQGYGYEPAGVRGAGPESNAPDRYTGVVDKPDAAGSNSTIDRGNTDSTSQHEEISGYSNRPSTEEA